MFRAQLEYRGTGTYITLSVDGKIETRPVDYFMRGRGGVRLPLPVPVLEDDERVEHTLDGNTLVVKTQQE